jgi:hypothetical protein
MLSSPMRCSRVRRVQARDSFRLTTGSVKRNMCRQVFEGSADAGGLGAGDGISGDLGRHLGEVEDRAGQSIKLRHDELVTIADERQGLAKRIAPVHDAGRELGDSLSRTSEDANRRITFPTSCDPATSRQRSRMAEPFAR